MSDFSLKTFREQRGLSQQALADMLGVAKNYVYLIESGRKPMTESMRRRLDELDNPKPNPARQLDGKTNTLAEIVSRLGVLRQSPGSDARKVWQSPRSDAAF